MDKSRALYEILNGVNGLERHTTISAGDKDTLPNIAKLCELVTSSIFEFADSYGGVDQKYGEDERAKLMDKELINEEILESDWLETIFGTSSKLENEHWLRKVSKDASWIFDASELRAKVLKASELDYRYG